MYVKCGGNHSSRDCVIERSTLAKCGNCHGNHPASYGAATVDPRTKKIGRPTQRELFYASMAKRSRYKKPTKVTRLAQKTSQAAIVGNTSMAVVMYDAFWANMETVMLDMQMGMSQLAESMKRAQQERGCQI